VTQVSGIDGLPAGLACPGHPPSEPLLEVRRERRLGSEAVVDRDVDEAPGGAEAVVEGVGSPGTTWSARVTESEIGSSTAARSAS